MKRISKILNISRILPAVMAIMALAACSDKDILIQEPDNDLENSGKQNGEGLFHMAFRLQMANEGLTRAAEGFVDGQYEEAKVENIMFLFFDTAGNQLFDATSSNITEIKKEKNDDTDGDGTEEDDETEAKEEIDNDDIEYEFNTIAAVSLGKNPNEYDKVKEEIKKIEQIFVIVNYDEKWSFGNETKKMTLKEVMEFPYETYRTVGKNNVLRSHLMTSAGFFDENGDYHCCYYKKDSNKTLFYDTKKEAKEHPVTLYVERVAAKVNITIHEDIEGIPVFYGENQFGNDIYELKFKPETWGVTATGKTTYLGKNLGHKSKYSETNGYDSNFFDWIHQSGYYHRVFWSESMFFNSGTYAIDGKESTDDDDALSLKYLRYSNIDNDNNNLPMARTFLEAKDDKGDPLKDEKGKPVKVGYTSEYILERTFSADLLKSAGNPNAIATSVVVYGSYNIGFLVSDKVPRLNDDDQENQTDPENGTEQEDQKDSEYPPHQEEATGQIIDNDDLKKGFYLRDVAMERVDGEHVVKYRLYLRKNKSKGEDDLYNAMLNEQYTVWIPKRNEKGVIEKGDDGKPLAYEQPVRAADKFNPDIFEVKNTYKYWNGEKLVPSPNQYTLQLKDWDKIEKILAAMKDDHSLEYELYYGKYDASKKEHHDMVKLTEGNLKDANEKIQETIGAAQFYYKAHAFFYSPIPHYSIFYSEGHPYKYNGTIHYKKNTDGSLVKDEETKKYIPDHLTGDLGVVRNHIYNLTVYSFHSLGYGRPEGDNIILPEPRIGREQEQFDIKLEILPWNEFNYTFDL